MAGPNRERRGAEGGPGAPDHVSSGQRASRATDDSAHRKGGGRSCCPCSNGKRDHRREEPRRPLGDEACAQCLVAVLALENSAQHGGGAAAAPPPWL